MKNGMHSALKRVVLQSIFSLKGNFAEGLKPTVREFDGVEITPFRGGAKGSATISADFEIAWAFRGRSVEERNLRAVRCRKNVPYLVRILEETSIPITWATVGHLFLESCERGVYGLAHADMPRPPKNGRWEGDWYQHDPCTNVEKHPDWYAPDLIQGILASRTQHEIGSHSFSHIDFSADTSSRELVRRELKQCIQVMAPLGLPLRSLVYPFNNMGHHHLDIIADLGLTAVRHRDPRIRLSYPERSPDGVYKLWESMNMRRAGLYDYVEKAKIFLQQALRQKAAYHLWFHPSDPTEIFENEFRRIIQYMAQLRDQGHLWVTTMGELAAYCEARQKFNLDVHWDSGSLRIRFESNYDLGRYGNTDVTLRIPLSRQPKKCRIRSAHAEQIIDGKPEARDPSGGRFFVFNVPVTAREMEVVL